MSESQPLPWRHLGAGAAAGTVAALLTCPLDVLKTRLQSSEFHKIGKMNLRSLTRQIIQQEGCASRVLGLSVPLLHRYCMCGRVSALWKGAGAIVAGVGPARAIHFFSYAQSKRLLESYNINGTQKHLLAAATAGLLSVTSA